MHWNFTLPGIVKQNQTDTLQTSAEHLFDTGLQHKVHVMKLICFGYDDVFGQRQLLYLVTVILYIVNRSDEFTRGSDMW